jgi:hypothetical protein
MSWVFGHRLAGHGSRDPHHQLDDRLFVGALSSSADSSS